MQDLLRTSLNTISILLSMAALCTCNCDLWHVAVQVKCNGLCCQIQIFIFLFLVMENFDSDIRNICGLTVLPDIRRSSPRTSAGYRTSSDSEMARRGWATRKHIGLFRLCFYHDILGNDVLQCYWLYIQRNTSKFNFCG